jgi:HPP family
MAGGEPTFIVCQIGLWCRWEQSPVRPKVLGPPGLWQRLACGHLACPASILIREKNVRPQGLDEAMPRPAVLDLLISWVGAFLGILLVTGLNQITTPKIHLDLLVASFGASAVLIFGVVESKLAQPRNFLRAFYPSSLPLTCGDSGCAGWRLK